MIFQPLLMVIFEPMQQLDSRIVAIVYGGYGLEAEISKKSAQQVLLALSSFDDWLILMIEVTKNSWDACDIEGNRVVFDPDSFTIRLNGKTHRTDTVFNAVHGPPGEDGELAIKLEQLKIPHTSSNSEIAKLTFDKRKCLEHLEKIGIKRAKYYSLDKNDPVCTESIIDKVGIPCFVKASRSGSSFGIEKVNRAENLSNAIENCLKVDSELLIEEALEGIEISVGVFSKRNKCEVLPMTEIVSHRDFFDYEAKYSGFSDEITPARISKRLEVELNRISTKIYKYLYLRGVVRSEYIIRDDEIYLIEVNTVPGFTEMSIIPQQVRHAGYSISEFFGLIVDQSEY